MAISEYKNGHFEEIRGWLQILEFGSNSTIIHLLFDTYDSPGAVFIWKWEKYRPHLLVWQGCSHSNILSTSLSVFFSELSNSGFKSAPSGWNMVNGSPPYSGITF